MGVEPIAPLVATALDSVPARRDVLVHMLAATDAQPTGDIVKALGLPRVSTTRALEELAAHGVLSWRKDGEDDRARYLWKPTERFAGYWQTIARERREST